MLLFMKFKKNRLVISACITGLSLILVASFIIAFGGSIIVQVHYTCNLHIIILTSL